MTRVAMIAIALLASSAAYARGAYQMPAAQLAVSEAPASHGFANVGHAILRLGQYALASFYGHGERLNKRTSTGELFYPLQLTAAHRTFPFGTLLKVAYRGKEVVVRVNDRGPAAWTGRSLDLSWGAARAIGLDRAGVAKVTYVVMN